MRLIATKQGRRDKYDALRCVRRDGSATTASMPRQGILPHDLLHYVVETALGYRHGFLGQVAGGADIGFAMAQSHDLQNSALGDQGTHAEAAVESLQAQLWNGAFDLGQFTDGLRDACAMRGRAAPDLGRLDVHAALCQAALALGLRWERLPYYGTLELEFALAEP